MHFRTGTVRRLLSLSPNAIRGCANLKQCIALFILIAATTIVALRDRSLILVNFSIPYFVAAMENCLLLGKSLISAILRDLVQIDPIYSFRACRFASNLSQQCHRTVLRRLTG